MGDLSYKYIGLPALVRPTTGLPLIMLLNESFSSLLNSLYASKKELNNLFSNTLASIIDMLLCSNHLESSIISFLFSLLKVFMTSGDKPVMLLTLLASVSLMLSGIKYFIVFIGEYSSSFNLLYTSSEIN